MPATPKHFARNIETKGRILRAVAAVFLLAGAGIIYPSSFYLSLGLAAGGGFVLFEALRGWCALRACGIKTKY